jgi:hypothetical protein
MRLVVGLRPKCCVSSVALLTLFVGLASTPAIDRASAQARTTTTTIVGSTTVTTTTLGANTGGIAANAATSAVQTALQGIRKRRTADPDVKPSCRARAALGGEPVGNVHGVRYRKCVSHVGRTHRL